MLGTKKSRVYFRLTHYPSQQALDKTCTICTISGMKLDEYMKSTGLTDVNLAKKLKRHRTAIVRYRNGMIMPPVAIIARIEELTSGSVVLRDFLGGKRRTK